MHLIEKRKISRALDHLGKSINLMTEVITLNRGIREVQEASSELMALGIIADD